MSRRRRPLVIVFQDYPVIINFGQFVKFSADHPKGVGLLCDICTSKKMTVQRWSVAIPVQWALPIQILENPYQGAGHHEIRVKCNVLSSKPFTYKHRQHSLASNIVSLPSYASGSCDYTCNVEKYRQQQQKTIGNIPYVDYLEGQQQLIWGEEEIITF